MTPSIQIRRYFSYWLWVVPILLLATVLISLHLTTDVFWFDELENFRLMGLPPQSPLTIDTMFFNLGVNRWPPAYSILLLVWGNLAGWSEFATRSLSLFMGVLSVAMMYRLGITFRSQRVGIIGTLLLSTSVFFIFYAHEIRGYIQYTLFTIIVLHFYWQQRKKRQLSSLNSFMFVTTATILIYTHYIALYILLALGLYHLFFAQRTPTWGKSLRLFIYVGIAYVPWISIAVLNAIGETSMVRESSLQSIMESIAVGFSNGLWFILFLLISYALIFVRNRATGMLIFCGILILVASLITNTLLDFLFHIRHLIGLLPILLLLSAIAIDHMLSHIHKLAWLFVILWVGAGIGLNRDLVFMDNLPGALENRPLEIMTATQEIANSCATDNDLVITHLASQQHIWNIYVEQHYLWDSDFTLAMIDGMVDFSNGLDTMRRDGTYESRLQEYITNAEQTWVFVADDAYTTSYLPELGTSLAQEYAYCDRVYQGVGVGVYLYQQEVELTCQSDLISTQTLASCAPNLLNDAIVPNG